ncbi:MAG: protein kinase [Deltaproteobacteria bacterium]|nr:protein kinase [Deltaproteobacteria bacterium]
MSLMICPACHREFDQGYLKCPYDGTPLVDARSAAAHDPFIGRQLAGTYQLVRLLGMGGMGSVYEARHVRLDTAFAVKLLHPQLSLNEELIARFHREARSASQLKHPHILEVFDVNKTEDGIHYIIEEYLAGQPLADLLAAEPVLPVERGVAILVQVCDAMAAAHKKGIVHRDLKPENIFLVDDPVRPDFVKVLDFGIAKMQQEGAKQLTQTAQVMGTPDYISPEQAADSKAVDARSDIYSTGVVVYRVFTGRLPYEIENPMLALEAVKVQDPVPPRQRRPDLPAPIEAVIAKAMARNPADRFATMTDLRLALLAVPTQLGLHGGAIPQTMRHTPVPRTHVSGHGAARADATGPRDNVPTAPTAPGVPPGRTGPPWPDARITPGRMTPDFSGQLGARTGHDASARKKPPVALLSALLVLLGGGGYAVYRVTRPATTVQSDAGLPRAADAGRASSPDAAAPRPDAEATRRADAAAVASDAAGTVHATARATVRIKAATLTIGRDDGTELERPSHSCTVADVELDRAEVSQGAFATFLASPAGAPLRKDKRWRGFKPAGEAALRSVTQVTWREADRYCRSRPGRRLPTEAEWELAAREHAAEFTKIIGGVGEWVADKFGAYTKTCGKRTTPPPKFRYGGAWTKLRVIRGGSDRDPKSQLTPTHRFVFLEDKGLPMVGFRCAHDVR